MARVIDTKVYKNVAPFIKSITNRQLAHELVIVKTNCDFHPNGRTLSHSMVWDETPQGFKFWSKLDEEYRINRKKSDRA